MAARDSVDELLLARVKATVLGGDHAPRLGRLVVLEPLGGGAMGTVFVAYDPQLDRRVAVKVLRGAADPARVLAEARALGRVAHPGVVAVHDAIEHGGAIVVVMELAVGPSLRAWLATPRAAAARLAVLAQVAEALAAVHAAGLVHGDVKPDNVVVGEARARLVDFGLAAAAGDDGRGGTPRYLAPERLAGGVAAASADQFAFGVMAHEAMLGAPPGRPATASAPRWLRLALERAVAASPAARWPSMAALAAELGHDWRRRRQVWALGGVAVAAAAVAVGLGVRGAVPPDPCGGAAARLDERWPAPAAAALVGSLGDAAWARRAGDEVGAYRAAWARSFRTVCEATRVRGQQADGDYALRMRCLERQVDRRAALGRVLGAAAPAERAAAAATLAALDPPAACEVVIDAGELALPDAPEARARAAAAQAAVDAAWAAYVLGRYRAAAAAAAAIERADVADAPGVAAELALVVAAVEGRLGAPPAARAALEVALEAAAVARAPRLEVEVWSRLLRGELFGGEPARVLDWAPFARAAARRAGVGDADLDAIVGEALRHAGRLDEAVAQLTRARDGARGLRGDCQALVELNLGAAELARGRLDDAAAALARAQALAEAALGADHPGLAMYLGKRGDLARARGALDEARALHDQALALREAAYGPDDRAVASALLDWAQTAIAAGRLDEADADLARAMAIRVATFGSGHARLGEIELARAAVAQRRGRAADAEALRRHALALDPRLASAPP